ncbi:thiol-disulfide oxidoreductase DCC family protein [Pseudoalteromonas tunicata]|jgi:predicted DCC family thiol-disulfide oxidoreductase YuxK|uniref:Potential redox protein n=1 Tax=Pseudoalteromonas tunicata D2 TaxID=87626 RepID=A4C4M1_9GAMM|nr:DUF393 domain-containing protein [Pseudoalteromonas tunicata]ATC97018.1 hypothetical protein PTUN_b0671 [Pseudoalteromonas tunicata]AXT33138.1 DUF393 domain-containing protein [Pseudoalteromonas tunicata]EAR30503.1 Potential redox protein [Pseudoalteromonas tunicata D2]
MTQLTVFYDGTCPLCVAEMDRLRELNGQNKLHFADIYMPDFEKQYPSIDVVAANLILHAQWQDGSMIYGLDVTVAAWQQVNKHKWLKILRFPVIKPLADWVYLFFAKNRYSISKLILGQSRCTSNSCELPKNNVAANNKRPSDD